MQFYPMTGVADGCRWNVGERGFRRAKTRARLTAAVSLRGRVASGNRTGRAGVPNGSLHRKAAPLALRAAKQELCGHLRRGRPACHSLLRNALRILSPCAKTSLSHDQIAPAKEGVAAVRRCELTVKCRTRPIRCSTLAREVKNTWANTAARYRYRQVCFVSLIYISPITREFGSAVKGRYFELIVLFFQS